MLITAIAVAFGLVAGAFLYQVLTNKREWLRAIETSFFEVLCVTIVTCIIFLIPEI